MADDRGRTGELRVDRIGAARWAWLLDLKERWELPTISEVVRRLLDMMREQDQQEALQDPEPGATAASAPAQGALFPPAEGRSQGPAGPAVRAGWGRSTIGAPRVALGRGQGRGSQR